MDNNGQQWTGMDDNGQKLTTLDNNGQHSKTMDNNVERNPIVFLEKSFCQLQFVFHFTLLIGHFFEKPNLPQNMGVGTLIRF